MKVLNGLVLVLFLTSACAGGFGTDAGEIERGVGGGTATGDPHIAEAFRISLKLGNLPADSVEKRLEFNTGSVTLQTPEQGIPCVLEGGERRITISKRRQSETLELLCESETGADEELEVRFAVSLSESVKLKNCHRPRAFEAGESLIGSEEQPEVVLSGRITDNGRIDVDSDLSTQFVGVNSDNKLARVLVGHRFRAEGYERGCGSGDYEGTL